MLLIVKICYTRRLDYRSQADRFFGLGEWEGKKNHIPKEFRLCIYFTRKYTSCVHNNNMYIILYKYTEKKNCTHMRRCRRYEDVYVV